MIATEMARIIDKEWDADKEGCREFILRRFPGEKAPTLVLALELVAEIFSADERYAALHKDQRK